jgi:hypothetical protein
MILSGALKGNRPLGQFRTSWFGHHQEGREATRKPENLKEGFEKDGEAGNNLSI